MMTGDDTRVDPRDLLLEIGVEELPARAGGPALEQLAAKAAAALAAARLAHGEITTMGAPRRLALLVREVTPAQQRRDVLVKGPAAWAAYDEAGAPTRAAAGFARARGVAVADLVVQADERGVPYVYARVHEAGRGAEDILPGLLRDLIHGLEFPQSMRWGARRLRFVRPIRWLVCLLGDRPLPINVEGVEAGRHTRGHRTLASGRAVAVPVAGDYAGVCVGAGVVVDPAARRADTWRQVRAVAGELGGVVPDRGDLLEEVTWLVEHPHAFAGRFDETFLELPEEVLVTAMRAHQRYFPVYARDDRDDRDDRDGAPRDAGAGGHGRLLPLFVAVRDGGEAHVDTVRRGNEKVLRARLSDARFFWDEDRRVLLESRLEKLRGVVFHEGLGSQYLRTERIVWLAARVSGALGHDEATRALVERTAWLCKCDLTTAMVGEFPELQGVMGAEYALAQGEDPAMAAGIAGHYLPRGAGDALPECPTGVAVGLADRLNTLAGFFGLGLAPTGSADPFALRRAAQGVTAIVVGHRLRPGLGALLDAALDGHARFSDDARARARSNLLEFFRARLEGAMREAGTRHDVADAVLAAGFDDMADAVARAEALERGLRTPELAAVAAAFKRIANIAGKTGADDSAGAPPWGEDGDGLEPAEAALWRAFAGVRAEAEGALAAEGYARFYQSVAALKGPVDDFFAAVLVMDPDPAARRRRLGLLRHIAALLTRPADLGRLTVG